jgi:4a-hydroxytetrahydrobiopterin dehydratase
MAGALARVPLWGLREGALETWRSFPSFSDALDFVVRVGAVADSMDHHPDIDLRYRRVRVAVWTHSAGGLTGLDFELAERVDALMA